MRYLNRGRFRNATDGKARIPENGKFSPDLLIEAGEFLAEELFTSLIAGYWGNPPAVFTTQRAPAKMTQSLDVSTSLHQVLAQLPEPSVGAPSVKT